ncbi:MAG TPA: sugar dehydratase [Candidatus Omnitrophica bacterium]|nr:MAG: sugar dehydratase [Omnitrophica WOR_2 bacterium GWA2_45_18]OGX19885.1 MAG: sugar dehydratase [Omnitrophica WOR_2 bacterium GWC2_45_7]HBR15951.1 sugar dehydratase [Candidatus Omnitrophota bacterium]
MEGLERLNHKFWNGRNVLVTGATGLVGSWLVKDLLKLAARVVVLVRDANPQSELYRCGDIDRLAVVNGELDSFLDVERAINEYDIQTILHLGAQTIVQTAHRFPLSTFEANIRGTYNLLEACRLHKDLVQQIVVASSDKAYGEQASLPYTEDMPLVGRHPYEVSKSCADLLSQSYYHSYQLPIVIMRCGNIFGGGDLNWSRIVPGTIRSFFRKENPIIRSDGKFIRDYVYVKDVARTYLFLAERLVDEKIQGEAFNFSDESPRSVLDIVGIIQKLMGCGHMHPEILNCVQGEIRSQYLSAEKLKKRLQWEARFPLERAMQETIEWYHAFLS